ncbi:MAG: hypothetical protein AAGG11_08055 [Pseudomonadota bacterium]
MLPDLTYQRRTSTVARNELTPLLEELIRQLEEEGRATEHACFRRIKRRLECAHDDTALAASIVALCTTAAVGFARSEVSKSLLERIEEKAALVSSQLDRPRSRVH